MPPFNRPSHSPGFSFIELLITLAVFSILAGAVFGFFTSQRDAYLMEELKLERDQNLGMAMESIFRELSSAGYRAADSAFVNNLPQWTPSDYIPSAPLSVSLDANPKVTFGEGDMPDVLTFACSVATATNPTTLSGESGGTEITVSISNSNSAKQYKKGDIISVGYLPEYAVVTAVDGNTLTVDSDPMTSGLQPLQSTYLEGTPLEEISIVSYTVFNDENDPAYDRHQSGCPVLKRKINAAGFYPVAENIQGMKVTQPEDGVLQVSLTGQVDEGASPGGENGEKVLAARISLRNALQAGFASGCSKPEAPGGLAAEDGLDESLPCQVLISWEPVTENVSGDSLDDAGCPVTGYRVYFDSIAGVSGNWVDVSAAEASGFTLDVSGIQVSECFISVAAENSGGLGEKSPEVAISDTTPPEKIAGISASVAGGEVALSWDENFECDLAGYYLYRKKDGGAFGLVSGLISAGAAEYTDAGLDAGASYTYRMEAVDSGFNASEMSDAVTIVLP